MVVKKQWRRRLYLEVVSLVKTGAPRSKRDRGGASQQVLTRAKPFIQQNGPLITLIKMNLFVISFQFLSLRFLRPCGHLYYYLHLTAPQAVGKPDASHRR